MRRVETQPPVPNRPVDSHKGLFGHALILGGSRGMAGAPSLAGAAALRCGAGLVHVASAAEVQPTVASFEPSYMTWPLATAPDGTIAFPEAQADLERLLERATVLGVGPGLGRSPSTVALTRWVVGSVKKPTVLDADALNAVSDALEILSDVGRPLILTPHPGEFSRLTGHPTSVIQRDRERHAVEFALRFPGIVLVLKGAGTVVTDGDRIYVNATGNPGLAKGGTGDVLTGVITGLLGQGLEPFEAAQLGVYVHGLAGDVARDHNGVVGMIAGDVVDALADVMEHLRRADPDAEDD